MRKFLIFAAASISINLVGCAAPQKIEWVKESASKQDTETALSECTYQIKLNKTEASAQPELLKLCMQGKGYRLRQVH